MKKTINILIIIIISAFFTNILTVKAYSRDSQEYKDCINKCETSSGGTNNPAYQACSNKCDSTTKENVNEKNEQLKADKQNRDNGPKTPVNFCASTASIWQIIGYVFLIVKIVIPIILIILGVLDFSKAVLGGKDDTLPKAIKTVMYRAIAAIIIFFIPSLVNLAMGLVSNFSSSGAKDDFLVCSKCILSPSKCDTSKDVGKQK